MRYKQYEPTAPSHLRTTDLASRGGLVHIADFAKLPAKGCSFAEWLDTLPNFLAVKDLKGLAGAIVAARQAGRPVIWAMGGHVVKVGCGPVVCDLMRRGIVTAIAMNGATATHDSELAICGQTSEDVGKALAEGMFGMAKEAPEVFAEAADSGPGERRRPGRLDRAGAAGSPRPERQSQYPRDRRRARPARHRSRRLGGGCGAHASEYRPGPAGRRQPVGLSAALQYQ